MAQYDPHLWLPGTLQDINALLSDAINLFASGNAEKASEAIKLVKYARDAAREVIDEIEDYEDGES
jgi:hypothetical protein